MAIKDINLESVQKAAQVVYDRWISKKLFAFLVATALLWFAKISEDVWEVIAVTYIGAQAMFDTSTAWKHGVGTKSKTKTDSVNPSPPSNEQGP